MQFNHILLYLLLVPHALCNGEEQTAITVDVLEQFNNGSMKIIDEEFTWHVAILRKREESVIFICSGTAVGGEFVITSANCAVPILTKELQVLINPANLSTTSFQDYERKDQICNVTKKYYHYYPDGLIVEADITVLKLQGCNIQQSARLTYLLSTDRFSKHCFALGWSGQFKMDLQENRYTKSEVRDICSDSKKYTKYNDHSLNHVLNMRNILGLSSMFILKVRQMIHSFMHRDLYEPNISQEETCQVDESVQRKRVDLSAKHHYKCLCSDSSQLCLYTRNPYHTSKQVDIGSPVFCKIKRERKEKQYVGTLLSQYTLVGVISNTSLSHIPLLKHNSFMKAVNISNFPKLLFALVKNEN